MGGEHAHRPQIPTFMPPARSKVRPFSARGRSSLQEFRTVQPLQDCSIGAMKANEPEAHRVVFETDMSGRRPELALLAVVVELRVLRILGR